MIAVVLGTRELFFPADKTIKIFLVSQKNLKEMRSIRGKSKLVCNCINTLKYMGSQNKVTLIWIPGQSSVEGE